MKTYHSILKIKEPIDKHIFMFNKYDGSNIRAEWTKKDKKFVRFGSRTQADINKGTPILHESIDLIIEKYQEELTERFINAKIQKALCFFEFYGPSSFAGQHVEGEKKDVKLFDINGDRGILLPSKFLEITKYLDICELLYEGKLNQEMIDKVRTRQIKNMQLEGVIVKGDFGTPGLPWMGKIKSYDWLAALKTFCKDDEALFKKLE